jgi:HPt (histidine-containing phosphotransfer) domain-containing protein
VTTNTSPEPEASDLPYFDEERFSELLECFSGDELRSLLESIPGEGAHCVRAIQDAIAANDLDAAKRAAHKLKGMASNLGAARIAEAARRVEQCARNGETRSLDGNIATLERALDETHAKIELMGRAR